MLSLPSLVRRDQSTPGCTPWMHLPTSSQTRSKNHHRRSHLHRIASCFPYNLRYMYLNWFPRPRASLPIGLARRIHAHRRVLGYFNYPDPLCVHSKQNSSHWPSPFESTVTVTTPCISLTSCPPHCNHRPPPHPSPAALSLKLCMALSYAHTRISYALPCVVSCFIHYRLLFLLGLVYT